MENGRSPVFDEAAALDRVEGDGDLFLELTDLFFAQYAEALPALGAAVGASAAQQIERLAHSIKSACGNVGAMRAFETAHQLEKAGLSGAVGSAPGLLSRLESDLREYRDEIGRFRARRGV